MIVEEDGSSLPDALRAHERHLLADPPDRIVLRDASDNALAAAVVATKLGVAVEATAAATDAPTTNARLIAQLAASYTEPA